MAPLSVPLLWLPSKTHVLSCAFACWIVPFSQQTFWLIIARKEAGWINNNNNSSVPFSLPVSYSSEPALTMPWPLLIGRQPSFVISFSSEALRRRKEHCWKSPNTFSSSQATKSNATDLAHHIRFQVLWSSTVYYTEINWRHIFTWPNAAGWEMRNMEYVKVKIWSRASIIGGGGIIGGEEKELK